MEKITTYRKNLIHNLPLIISGCAFAVLHVTAPSRVRTAAMLIFVLICAAPFLENVFFFWKKRVSALTTVLTCIVLAIYGNLFYKSSIHSSKLQHIAERAGIHSDFLVLLITIVACIAAFYSLSWFLAFLLEKVKSSSEKDFLQPKAGGRVSKKELVFLIVTAIGVMTICSKSSPLYPLNDWIDSNCFLTVGKSMLYGKMPYRDLFEQKGPLLYMLHALAAVVSETSFLGVYFLEIFACAVFLFYSIKIIRLYEESASVLLMPVLSVLVYTASSFCHGDSAEELCLPFYAFAIYVGLRSLQKKQIPTKLECLAIGLTSSCVLWIKFSLLGFYLGWICVPAVLLVKEKKIAQLLQMLLLIGVGVVAASVPIIIYFAANDALSDLWTVYFYNNLFYYSTDSSSGPMIFSLVSNLLEGVKNVLSYNYFPMVLTAIGLLILSGKKEKTDFWFVFSSMAASFFLVFVGGQRHRYYSHILSAFLPVGFAAIMGLVHNALPEHKTKRPHPVRRCVGVVSCLVCVVYAFLMCENTYLLRYKKTDMPQYQFAEKIAQVEDATLLNYGFLDGGFYTTTGIVPNCRYFCNLNIAMEEIMKTQEEYVQNGAVDFVVTRDEELKSDLYVCVARAVFPFERVDREYFLYQLIE